MTQVRRILMAQQRLSRRRLPDRVVLRQADTGHRRQSPRELADQQPDDPTLQAELAATYFRAWQVYMSVDQGPASDDALRQALDIVDQLRREAALKGAVERGMAMLQEYRGDPEGMLNLLRNRYRRLLRPSCLRPELRIRRLD